MMKIDYQTTPEFEKDFKKLCKKYRTLPDDFEMLKKATIELFHLKNFDNNSIFLISGFCNDKILSYKIKKFASKSFKGKGAKTGLRVTYIYLIEKSKIIFVEIYYKGVQENENKQRLQKYFNLSI